MNVRDEINKYAAKDDREALNWLFDHYHMQSEWNFVARCSFEKLNGPAKPSVRVWSPSSAGRSLFVSRELLEALKALLDTTRDALTDGLGCTCERCVHARCNADSIIAKAEGVDHV